MPPIIPEIFDFLGYLVSALGLLIFGFTSARFALDAFQKAGWQVQVALVIGFFGLLAALANYTSPGSTGAFALGAAIAFFLASAGKKEAGEEGKKK